MYSYQREDVSIKTVLDTRRALKDGSYRIRIRVFHKGKYWEYSTGKKLSPQQWDELPATNSRNLKSIRNDIQSTFEIIKKHVQELTENELFSFEGLNKRLQRNIDETLNSMLQQKIDTLEKENRFGTAEYYSNIKSAVERYRGERIPFISINIDWLKGFERFLLAEKKAYTTIGMYARGIRHIFNMAKENGIIKEFQYPFGKNKYEIPTGTGRKLALTIQQIGKVVNYTDGNPITEKYRDLWFFSYLANGINFSDMLKLKFSDIVNGEICWYRQKTINTNRNKKLIQAYVTPEMKAIIKRWGNPLKPDNYIFPYFENGMTPKKQNQVVADVVRRVNRKMKYIGEQTKVGKISTYTARHSFATVLKRSGTNVEFISESLGHADLKTTENYLASFEKKERAKNSALLTSFNKKNKVKKNETAPNKK